MRIETAVASAPDAVTGTYYPAPDGFLAITEEQLMIGKRVLVRTFSAGVHFGELVSRDGKECVLKNARRIWYWSGAASLSQLAVDGTSQPEKCKFPISVPEILLTEVIEYIPVTEKAAESIDGVPVWSM